MANDHGEQIRIVQETVAGLILQGYLDCLKTKEKE